MDPPKMGIQSVAGQYTSISIGELLRLFPCEGQDRKSTSFVLGVLTISLATVLRLYLNPRICMGVLWGRKHFYEW